MTGTKLLPTRCIVDRTVLVELLGCTEMVAEEWGQFLQADRIDELAEEVRTGQRVELYARDWPGGDAS